MIFKVRWGDLKKEFSRKHAAGNSQGETPIKFYFEDEVKILLFLKTRGLVLHSELFKADIDIKSFKFEFLSDVTELVENPIKNKWLLSEI